jgi:hypothetical protein
MKKLTKGNTRKNCPQEIVTSYLVFGEEVPYELWKKFNAYLYYFSPSVEKVCTCCDSDLSEGIKKDQIEYLKHRGIV